MLTSNAEGTANLIIHMLSVDRKWVHPLPMDVPTIIPNTGGVTVTLIEANHCTRPPYMLIYLSKLIDWYRPWIISVLL